MPQRYAGRFGPLAFTDLAGNADLGATVDVFLPTTSSRAALWGNKDRSAGLTNPLPIGVTTGAPGLDVAGNTMFFADPGDYDVRVTFSGGGFSGQSRTYRVTVDLDPTETLDIDTAIAQGDAASRNYADSQVANSASALTDYINGQISGIVSGTGWALRGQWSSAATYLAGDVVFFDGSSYVATAGVGPDPTSPPGNVIWQILAQGVTAALTTLINQHESRLDAIDLQLAGGGTGGSGGVTLASMPADSVIAYQHGANIGPEHSVEAARLSTAVGARGIHAVIRRLADDTLVAFTDADVSRVTTGTGNVTDYTGPGWQPLVLDADAWFAPPWTGLKVIMAQRLFDDFGGRSMLVLEPATAAVRASLITELVDRGLQKASVIVAGDAAAISAIKAAGCQSLLVLADTTGVADALAAGVDVLAATDAISSDDLDAVTAQLAGFPGVKLWGWRVDRRFTRDRMRAHGVTGIVTPEPGYLARSEQIKRVSTWATQTYPHGLVAGGIDPRPKFGGTEQIRFDAVDGQQWALLGEQSPNVDDYTLTVEFLWPTLPAEASPLDRVGIAFGMSNDLDFTWSGTIVDTVANPDAIDRNILRDGYLATFSKNGTVRIRKVDRSANTVTDLASAAGVALVAGTYVTLRVQVSGDNLTAEIVGTIGTVTVADTSFRGGYFHLGKLGSVQSARFRNLLLAPVTVTPAAIPSASLFAVRAATSDPNTTADTSTLLKAWQNLNAAPPTGVGPLDARRSNESIATGIPATWSVSAGAFDEAQGADPSLYQFRSNWQRMIDGLDDAALTAFVNSIPTGHDVYLAWAPLADTNTDTTETSGLGAAGFIAAYQHFAAVVKATGKTNVYRTLVLDFRARIAAGDIEQWYPGNTAVQKIGIRAINSFDPANGVNTWDLVTDLLTDAVTWAGTKGKQWGIWDAGTRSDPARTNRKATWVQNLYDWSEGNPRALWISYSNVAPYWLRDSADAVTTFAEIVNPTTTTPGTPPVFQDVTLVERSNVTNIIFDVPSTVADGDTLLLFVATGLNEPTLSDPTTGGWVSAGAQVDDIGGSGTRLCTRLWHKKWHTGDPMTGTIPASVSTRADVACLRYNGTAAEAGEIEVVATSVEADTDNIIGSPAVTTVTAEDRVLRFFAHRGLGTSWVAPAGTTKRGEQFASNAAGAAILVVDEPAHAAGVYPAANATSDLANGFGVGWTIGLKSGTGGGGGGGGTAGVPAGAPFIGVSANGDFAGGDTSGDHQSYLNLDNQMAVDLGITAPVMRLRHSYSTGWPSTFGSLPCSSDFGDMPAGTASLVNVKPGYTDGTFGNGDKNSAIDAWVKTFPKNDHTYYVVANHEPENDCGNNCAPTATDMLRWRRAQLQWIRAVLGAGRANVIPATVLMAASYQTWGKYSNGTDRQDADWNFIDGDVGALTAMTADEKLAFVWCQDGYTDSQTGNAQASVKPGFDFAYGKGIRRFGIAEHGFRSDGSTTQEDNQANYINSPTDATMLRLYTEQYHSGAIEFVAWFHNPIGGTNATQRTVYFFHSAKTRKAYARLSLGNPPGV